MAKKSAPQTAIVAGKQYDVTNLDSIAPLFSVKDSQCGVYRLRFTDGDAYVGQSVHVVTRYVDHFKRWGREIESFEFFPVEQTMLNEVERELITATEQDSSVRNVLLTKYPRGRKTVEFTLDEGVTVSLPWKRDERKRIIDDYEPKQLKRLVELGRHEYYSEVLEILAWYVSEAIPDPVRTAGQLWTLTCLPSTNQRVSPVSKTRSRRLATLSCGNLESLFIEETTHGDSVEVELLFNTTRLQNPWKYSDPNGLWSTGDFATYRIAKTTSWIFPIENFAAILDGDLDFPHLDFFVDSSYELNVQSMRRGGTMYSRFHNPAFTLDVLNEATYLMAENG